MTGLATLEQERFKFKKYLTMLLEKFHNERNDTFLKGRRLLMFLMIYDNSPMSAIDLKYNFAEVSQAVLNGDIMMLIDIGYIQRISENDQDLRQKAYLLTDRGVEIVDEWLEAIIKE